MKAKIGGVIMKKVIAFLLALTVAVTPFVSGFASEEISDPRIETVEVNSEGEVPEEETAEPEDSEEPATEPETPEESVVSDENKTVAAVSICSNMSVPLIAGHTYIYVENLSDEPIQVGLYEVPVGQGVSVGAFSFSAYDGWGLYYNLEAFRENRDNKEGSIWSKTRQLNASQLEKLSSNIRNYLNHWDPFFNCSFFAFSVWNASVGDLLIPLVLPVLSHLMVMISGGHKGALDMYYPDEEQVFRQKGIGSNARLEPISKATLNA